MSVGSSWTSSVGCVLWGPEEGVPPSVCLPPLPSFPWLFDGSEFSALLLGSGLALCAWVPAQARFQVFLPHPQGLTSYGGPGALRLRPELRGHGGTMW